MKQSHESQYRYLIHLTTTFFHLLISVLGCVEGNIEKALVALIIAIKGTSEVSIK